MVWMVVVRGVPMMAGGVIGGAMVDAIGHGCFVSTKPTDFVDSVDCVVFIVWYSTVLVTYIGQLLSYNVL